MKASQLKLGQKNLLDWSFIISLTTINDSSIFLDTPKWRGIHTDIATYCKNWDGGLTSTGGETNGENKEIQITCPYGRASLITSSTHTPPPGAPIPTSSYPVDVSPHPISNYFCWRLSIWLYSPLGKNFLQQGWSRQIFFKAAFSRIKVQRIGRAVDEFGCMYHVYQRFRQA